MGTIESNLKQVLDGIPSHVTVVAISKTKSVEEIMQAYRAGHRIFGENKVQELLGKCDELPDDIQWHLVGHLQTNKVKYVLPKVHLIHSVDSWKLALEIEKMAARLRKKIPVLLQVYIAKEESKFGLDEQELIEICEAEEHFPHLEFKGLMGMASNTDDVAVVRNEFKYLKNKFEEVKTKYLFNHPSFTEISMGMSNDYKIAIEEGSTMVRIGSAIFGNR